MKKFWGTWAWLKTQLLLRNVAAAVRMCKNISSEFRYLILARAIAGMASNNFVITGPVAPRGGLARSWRVWFCIRAADSRRYRCCQCEAGWGKEETTRIPFASLSWLSSCLRKCQCFPPRLSFLYFCFCYLCLLLFVSIRVYFYTHTQTHTYIFQWFLCFILWYEVSLTYLVNIVN